MLTTAITPRHASPIFSAPQAAPPTTTPKSSRATSPSGDTFTSSVPSNTENRSGKNTFSDIEIIRQNVFPLLRHFTNPQIPKHFFEFVKGEIPFDVCSLPLTEAYNSFFEEGSIRLEKLASDPRQFRLMNGTSNVIMEFGPVYQKAELVEQYQSIKLGNYQVERYIILAPKVESDYTKAFNPGVLPAYRQTVLGQVEQPKDNTSLLVALDDIFTEAAALVASVPQQSI